jgi:protein SCO1/2
VIRALALALALGLPAMATAGAAPPFDPFHLAGVDQRPGARAPLEVRVTDEAGRSVSLAQLAKGRPVVLAPVQHRCPNICGFTLAGLAQAVRGQAQRPGRDFEIVAFGFDPRETPADAAVSARRLAAALGGAAGVHAVVGDARADAAVLGALGYRYAWDPRLGQYAHVAAYAVLAPDGRLARWVYGIAPQPKDLEGALADARQRRSSFGEQLLLLCYHYAPLVGRYSPTVQTAVRIGGVATVLGLAGLVVVLARRGRRGRAT